MRQQPTSVTDRRVVAMNAAMSDEEAYRRLGQLCDTVRRWAEQEQREQVPRTQPGSRTAADDTLTDPYQLSHAVRTYLTSSLDHLQALRALLEVAQVLHMAAPFTLCRAAMENAAHVLWLLRPDDRLQRVGRRLQLAVRDADEGAKANEVLAAGSPTGLQAAAPRREKFAAIGEAAGVPRSIVLGKPSSAATVVGAANDVIDLEGRPLEFLWRLCSGYTHSQSWSLLTAGSRERMLDSVTDGPVSDYAITADATTAMICMGAAVSTLQEARRLHDRHRVSYTSHPRGAS